MKVNDKKEIHGKSASEIRKMLKEGHELLLSLQLDRSQNKLKNTKSVFTTRKNIAILKTILKGKEGNEEIKDQKSNLKREEVSEKPAKKAKAEAAKPEAKTTKAKKV